MHKFNSKVERVNLSNVCNFQPFASNNKENSSNRKLWNCWVAKTLMSPYIVCLFSMFSKIISPRLFGISGTNFHDNWNCYVLSIFREFVLIAWSENEGHNMLISQKTKIRLLQFTMRLLTVSLWLKTCSLSAVFFKHFISQGNFIFYSRVEILQIKTTQ